MKARYAPPRTPSMTRVRYSRAAPDAAPGRRPVSVAIHLRGVRLVLAFGRVHDLIIFVVTLGIRCCARRSGRVPGELVSARSGRHTHNTAVEPWRAIALIMLRKVAFHLFGTALALSIMPMVIHALAKGLLAALGGGGTVGLMLGY